MISAAKGADALAAPSQNGQPTAVHFHCPECRQPLNALAEAAGSQINCPVCSVEVFVPRRVVEANHRIVLEWSCPQCDGPLRLIEELHSRKIRCQCCETVLEVSSKPWALTTIVRGRQNRSVRKSKGAAEEPSESQPAPQLPTAPDAAARAMAAAANPSVDAPVHSAPMPKALRKQLPAHLKKRKAIAEEARVFTPARLLVAGLTAASVLLVALLGWRLLFGGQVVDPRLRYLPIRFEAYTTLDVSALRASEVFQKAHDTFPAPPRLTLYETFLSSLEISLAEVSRISFAGDPQGGSGGVVIYELTRPLDPAMAMARARVRPQSQSEEKVAGKPFWVLGPVAMCFAEPHVLLVGRTLLLRTMLERASSGLPGPLLKVVPTLDFSKTRLGVSLGLPASDFLRVLLEGADPQLRISMVSEEGTYQDNVRLTRTLTLADELSAQSLARHVQGRMRTASSSFRTGGEMARLLKLTKVSAVKQTVVIETTIPLAAAVDSRFGKFVNRVY